MQNKREYAALLINMLTLSLLYIVALKLNVIDKMHFSPTRTHTFTHTLSLSSDEKETFTLFERGIFCSKISCAFKRMCCIHYYTLCSLTTIHCDKQPSFFLSHDNIGLDIESLLSMRSFSLLSSSLLLFFVMVFHPECGCMCLFVFFV